MGAPTAADLRFFEEHGYVRFREAVPPALCRAVIDAVFGFLEMNPDDPDDWYRPPHVPGGMVELYQHQALWDTRQHPPLHGIFTALRGTERLWVSVDRAAFKPPARADRPGWDHPGFLHVDADVSALPIPFGLQGVLYLDDTGPDQGGFKCLPGWHRREAEWARIATLPREEFAREVAGLPVVPIEGRTGDFVVWHRALPHGNGRNASDRPRFAQYISMFPVPADPGRARADRVRRWSERLAPEAPWVVGDPRGRERERGRTADLTPLGRRLLGLDPWPG